MPDTVSTVAIKTSQEWVSGSAEIKGFTADNAVERRGRFPVGRPLLEAARGEVEGVEADGTMSPDGCEVIVRRSSAVLYLVHADR